MRVTPLEEQFRWRGEAIHPDWSGFKESMGGRVDIVDGKSRHVFQGVLRDRGEVGR